MESLTLDSSVLVALFNQEDSHHQQTRHLIEFLKDQSPRVIVPLTIILEVVHILQKKAKGKTSIPLLLEYFGQFQIVNLDTDFISLFIQHHTLFSLKTADTIVAITAFAFQTTLVSWDDQLIKQAKSHIRAVTPLAYHK